MTTQITTPITFRVLPRDLALALDGLNANNLLSNPKQSISSIVRTTFFHGILSFGVNVSKEPSQESMNKITQILNQNKRNKIIDIKDLLA
jgi:hypothetical protein